MSNDACNKNKKEQQAVEIEAVIIQAPITPMQLYPMYVIGPHANSAKF